MKANFLLLLLVGGLAGDASAVEQELKIFISSPATLALDIYQRFLSPAKGTSCPMEPSDSAYAREAIGRHGLLEGALMTADRLHRCGHDVSRYPLVRTSRGLKYSDPVP